MKMRFIWLNFINIVASPLKLNRLELSSHLLSSETHHFQFSSAELFQLAVSQNVPHHNTPQESESQVKRLHIF